MYVTMFKVILKKISVSKLSQYIVPVMEIIKIEPFVIDTIIPK